MQNRFARVYVIRRSLLYNYYDQSAPVMQFASQRDNAGRSYVTKVNLPGSRFSRIYGVAV